MHKKVVGIMTDLARSAPGVNSRRRGLLGLGAAALAATFALGLLGPGHARGDVPPLQIIGLAQGSSPERRVDLDSKGPTDVLQTQLIFQPGAATGWHTHPGPVIVVVKTGSLTEVLKDGCIIVHPAGSVFFEEKNEVHNAVNHTGMVTELYATFISPPAASR